MDNSTAFTYNYSAPVNKEVLEIRKKYLPQEETKLDELRRLDALVQSSGVMESLCVGIVGCLVFGLGMCMGMQVIGGGMILGVLLGIAGMAVMMTAYPMYCRHRAKTKEAYAPRILELAEELAGITDGE
ncbi:MAG: hypothetical protein J6I64_04830 [Lachnospiraceae bacterium]|nr:hypothetical protein [Lachnospiraceae bacterium]